LTTKATTIGTLSSTKSSHQPTTPKSTTNKKPMNGTPSTSMIPSTLYTIHQNNDNNKSTNNKGKKKSTSLVVSDQQAVQDTTTSTKLGDYILDKLTTTGDIIEIGMIQYRVIRHRCQYKYQGGKKFIMYRKILEVKEINRWQQEEYLHRTWQLISGDTNTKKNNNHNNNNNIYD
jgi:hypothetical protein